MSSISSHVSNTGILYVVSVCGGVFDAEEGNATSPLFPYAYPGSMDCNYTLIVPENEVAIKFHHTHLD